MQVGPRQRRKGADPQLKAISEVGVGALIVLGGGRRTSVGAPIHRRGGPGGRGQSSDRLKSWWFERGASYPVSNGYRKNRGTEPDMLHKGAAYTPYSSTEDSTFMNPSRGRQLIEVSVFLLLIIPAMFLSLAGIKTGRLDFPVVALSGTLSDLGMLSLVLYFVWCSEEGFSAVGWVKRDLTGEAALGALLFVPFFFGVGLVAWIFQSAGLSAPPGPPAFLIPHGMLQLLAAVAFLAVVAVSEETIFRGYLIRRFAAVTGSRSAAIVLSSAVFAIGHGYEGSAGVATVGVMGVVFALVYLWRGSLVAPIAMHFLQDLISILVPALGGTH